MNDLSKIKVGIAGGAGYTGGELLRLLLRHPNTEIVFVQSRSQAGRPLSDAHPDLLGECDLHFIAEAPLDAADVLFLCLGHGESRNWLNHQTPRPGLKVIDLSQDHRAGGQWGDQSFVYGLPEAQRDAIRAATLVANPGCFATGIQLALLPVAERLGEVFVTGITGATGAGQSLSATSHFPWRHANVSAYKTLTHQHLDEINATLHTRGAPSPRIHFVPWRGDFTRGIFLSCTLRVDGWSQEDILLHYRDFYQTHPFVVVSGRMVDLKMTVNTNKCVIFPEKQGEHLVVHATLDNLLKGASGQAVQNMNLLFGLAETTGLQLKASAF